MYLEKLEINGFKSFANKNKLIFSGILSNEKRGLTAIVGPNGSGKSNVADAIRWALGEQSLKTLRGKKSEDIIFSGSDKKGRLGSAEVSLHLNNSDKTFALNNNQNLGEEKSENDDHLNKILATCDHVVITRRIFRNGESEYLLNDNRVRLTDIQMLLAKANFGQKTYSVIGQGMVENFLTVSAAERKDFFDEATGVKQFQIKRDSSLNKLESSYENLRQVDMLLLEIRPRLKSLTRQVEKLKKREEIEKDLNLNQINYYSHLWHDINGKLKKANQELLVLEKDKQEKEKKLEKFNEELIKIQTTDSFKEINELEPRLREKESQKNQALKEISKLQAEMEAKLEAQGQFDLSWLSSKKSELENQLENIAFEISSLEKLSPEKEELLTRAELEEINKKLKENSQLKYKKQELEREKNLAENKISRLETIISANLEAKGEVDLDWLKNKAQELKTEKDELTNRLTTFKTETENNKKESLRNEIAQIEKELNNLQGSLNDINRRLKENKEKLKGREEIEKLVDDFLSRLDQINREDSLEKIKNLIAEAKKDFGTKIKNLISGEDEKSLEEIKLIQEKIISLSETKQKLNADLAEENYRLNSLGEKIAFNREKLEEKERELNDLKIKIEKAEIKFDFAGTENEKRELEKEIKNIEIKIKEIEENDEETSLLEKKQGIEKTLQEILIKKSSLQERKKLLTEKNEGLKLELEGVITKISKGQIKFDAEQIKNEEEKINLRVKSLNEDIAELRQELDVLKEKQEKEKAVMFELQKNAQTKQQELNLTINDLNKVQMEAARQETRLEDLEASIRNENLSVLEIENYSRSEEDAGAEFLPKKINSLKNQLDQIGGIDPEVEKEYEETKQRYDFLKSQTDDLDKTISSLEEIIAELDKTIKKKFDAEFKVISEKFSEYFKILFNGGEAKISKLTVEDNKDEKNKTSEEGETQDLAGLSEEENRVKNEIDKKLKKIKQLRKHGGGELEGIEVQAVPPGKKIQTVTMLSGGERALTAIALISAIISANPSPFVVLDEVDAALDEANSERLARILDDLSDKTQFIVITHNRASMKKASILYGVTMQADGVSQLLSVKLDDLEKLE
ncbi:AAA family ATPase [Patescibacteria group bacterium]|nr:AAA family ATPase [Patescibacteria group bacterium]